MQSLLRILVCLSLGLVNTSSTVLAQSGSGAEARLQERNITLPPVPAPVANYVDFVRVGNLLFLAGNTAGAELEVQRQGRERYHSAGGLRDSSASGPSRLLKKTLVVDWRP